MFSWGCSPPTCTSSGSAKPLCRVRPLRLSAYRKVFMPKRRARGVSNGSSTRRGLGCAACSGQVASEHGCDSRCRCATWLSRMPLDVSRHSIISNRQFVQLPFLVRWTHGLGLAGRHVLCIQREQDAHTRSIECKALRACDSSVKCPGILWLALTYGRGQSCAGLVAMTLLLVTAIDCSKAHQGPCGALSSYASPMCPSPSEQRRELMEKWTNLTPILVQPP